MSGEVDARQRVHEAVTGLLDDGEIAIAWCLTIDVAGLGDVRYLAHRAGGGHDGSESPTVWAALGMIRAGLLVAEQQLIDVTEDADDEEGDEVEDSGAP